MLINKLWKTHKISTDIAFQDIFLKPFHKTENTRGWQGIKRNWVFNSGMCIQYKICG